MQASTRAPILETSLSSGRPEAAYPNGSSVQAAPQFFYESFSHSACPAKLAGFDIKDSLLCFFSLLLIGQL